MVEVEYPPYSAGPGIGHEIGVMFGFMAFCILMVAVYWVVWQGKNAIGTTSSLNLMEKKGTPLKNIYLYMLTHFLPPPGAQRRASRKEAARRDALSARGINEKGIDQHGNQVHGMRDGSDVGYNHSDEGVSPQLSQHQQHQQHQQQGQNLQFRTGADEIWRE